MFRLGDVITYKICFLALCMGQLLQGQNLETRDFYPPSIVPDRVVLTFSSDPSTAIAITWRTSSFISRGFVEIVEADATPDFIGAKRHFAISETFRSNKNTATYHTCNVTGLNPNTQYSYRVGDGVIWSEWTDFRTAKQGAHDFSFIYLGDAQNDLKSRWTRTVRKAFRHAPRHQLLSACWRPGEFGSA